MANIDAPRGFWPLKHVMGGTIRANKTRIASTLANDIYKGDMVKLVAGGGVELVTAGDRVLGLFDGVQFTASDGSFVYSKRWDTGRVATDIIASVYDDPNIVFGVQSAGSTVEADIGNLGDVVATAGDATTKSSRQELNGSTAATIATFRVLDKIDTPNNAWGTNVDLQVVASEHQYHVTDTSGAPTTPGI